MRFFLVPQAQKCNSWGRVRLGVKFAKFCQICQICQLLPIWPNFALQGQNLPSEYSFCSLNQRLIKLQSLTLLDCKIGASRTFRSRILQSARSTFTPSIRVFWRSENANFAKVGKFAKFGKILQIWPPQVPQPQIDNFPGPRPGKIAFFRKNANLAKFAFFGKNGDLTPRQPPTLPPLPDGQIGGLGGNRVQPRIWDPDPGFRDPGSRSGIPESRIWIPGSDIPDLDIRGWTPGWCPGCQPGGHRMTIWLSGHHQDVILVTDMSIPSVSWHRHRHRHGDPDDIMMKNFVSSRKNFSSRTKIFCQAQKNFVSSKNF